MLSLDALMFFQSYISHQAGTLLNLLGKYLQTVIISLDAVYMVVLSILVRNTGVGAIILIWEYYQYPRHCLSLYKHYLCGFCLYSLELSLIK